MCLEMSCLSERMVGGESFERWNIPKIVGIFQSKGLIFDLIDIIIDSFSAWFD